jgi:hypothetical protein
MHKDTETLKAEFEAKRDLERSFDERLLELKPVLKELETDMGKSHIEKFSASLNGIKSLLTTIQQIENTRNEKLI